MPRANKRVKRTEATNDPNGLREIALGLLHLLPVLLNRRMGNPYYCLTEATSAAGPLFYSVPSSERKVGKRDE